MTGLITLVIPLQVVVHDVQPAESLCRQFHFSPKKLIEAFVHEWFRYQRRSGPYQLDNVFYVSHAMVIDFLKPTFLLPVDCIVNAPDVEDVEAIIDRIGYQVMHVMRDFTDTLGIPTDTVKALEIVGWCNECLLVRMDSICNDTPSM